MTLVQQHTGSYNDLQWVKKMNTMANTSQNVVDDNQAQCEECYQAAFKVAGHSLRALYRFC